MIALPGGKVEADENFIYAAIREVKEETGLDIEIPDRNCFIHAGFDDVGFHVTTLVGYLTRGLHSENFVGPEGTRVRLVEWTELLSPSNPFTKYNSEMFLKLPQPKEKRLDYISLPEDDALRLKFKDVKYVLTANSFEISQLWSKYSKIVKWESSNGGPGITIGEIEGRNVWVAVYPFKINGETIIQLDCTSQLVDYKMLDDWIADHFPLIGSKSLDASVDANNFHRVVNKIREATEPPKPVEPEKVTPSIPPEGDRRLRVPNMSTYP